MPLRELKYPHQVTSWLEDWGGQLRKPGEMILIGSAALLWHAARQGLDEPLPESSMDVDPVTDCEEIAELAYDAMIGSEFEREHGWHVNLMPPFVFDSFPDGWRERCQSAEYGRLRLLVPAVADLLAAKSKRNDPRDKAHASWAEAMGLT